MYLNKYECPLCKSIGNNFLLHYPNLTLSANLAKLAEASNESIKIFDIFPLDDFENLDEWMDTIKTYIKENLKGIT